MIFSDSEHFKRPDPSPDIEENQIFKGFVYSYPKLVRFDQRLVSLPDYEMLIDKGQEVETGIPVGRLRYFDDEEER